ncbi:Ig-like domain-containing protein, partial [Pantoea agglomerans]
MSLKQVNIAVVDNRTIVKADVLRTEKTGAPVKIKAVKGAKYILAEGEKGFAPENITVKRVGKALHVMLEGTDDRNPQLIIENFFDNPGELVGKAEDGQWHEYISSDGDSDHQAAFLMDGDSSALVLGAGTIGSLDGIAVAPFALSPALIALGALAGLLAAAGLTKVIAEHNKDSGDNGNGNESGAGGGNLPYVPTPVLNDVLDDKGDFQGPVANGGLTDDDTPTLEGTGTPGHLIVIRDNGNVIGSTQVGDDGKWTWTPEIPLTDGEHKFELVERDKDGHESGPTDGYVIIIDTEAPVRPGEGGSGGIEQIFDDVEPKMGPIAKGGWTNDDTPTLSGSKQTPGDIIIIRDNGKEIGSAMVSADGTWVFTPQQPLEDGKHSFDIIARDPAGNRSEPSDAWDIIIDTTIPTKPGDGNTPGIDDIIDDVGPVIGSIGRGDSTDDTKPMLEGSYQKPGTIITIIDNGEVIGSVVANEDGAWTFTPETDLSEGQHDFTIIIETPTGHVSPESDPWPVIIDLTPPEAPVIVELIDDQGAVTGAIRDGDTTDDAQPEIRGTAEANSTVIIYDNGREIGSVRADGEGNWTFIPVPPLLNGSHNISAKAQDAAGNIGEESDSIGFELISGGNATAPAIIGAWDDVEAFTGMLDNGALTNDARPEIRGSALPGATVTLYLDGRAQGTVVANESGQWSWTPGTDLTDGTHNFRAETTDAAGNAVSTGNFQLVIDTTAPDAGSIGAEDNVGTITGPVESGDTTDDSTPTFGGEAEPGATV